MVIKTEENEILEKTITLYKSQFKTENDGYPGDAFDEILREIGLDPNENAQVYEITIKAEKIQID